MAFIPFPPHQPFSSAHLLLTLMTLNDWMLVTVSGPDSEKYLQGQITANVSNLTDAQYLFAAHCNTKGKAWSSLRIFRRDSGFAWIEHRSLHDVQLTELRKYAVLFRVTVAANDDLVLLGVAGFQARAVLAPLFAAPPDAVAPMISEDATSLLWFEHPGERFLLMTDVDTFNRATDTLCGGAQLGNSQQWLALNTEAGLPIIDSVNNGQFISQTTSLQALGGVSFRKGCYTGQEVVARAKFHGANKRALRTLSGIASRVPEAGEDLELKMGDNWYRTRTVLAVVQLDDGQLLVQVMMSNDMEPDNIFRVHDDTGNLRIEPLLCSLEDV